MPEESQTHLDYNTKNISMEEAGDWLLSHLGLWSNKKLPESETGKDLVFIRSFFWTCLIIMYLSYLYKKNFFKKNISSRN